MAERKKTKFDEELEKLLENIAANNEDWNDPIQKGMYDYRQFQNGTVVREDDPLTKRIKEYPYITPYLDTEPSPYPDSKYGWPTLAREGEPAFNDPGLVLRNAAATAGDRRDRNIENAKRKFAQTIDDLDRNLNPESYGNKRSGRIAPAGGRAGLANLNRPQYIAAMNESIQAPNTLARENFEGASSNSKEAQYDKVMRGLGFEKNDSNEYEFKNKASAAKREALQKSVDDYDKQIKALEEEIALSEAGDPLYDLAVMRLIMDDDNTLMSDIRGKIAKRVDREFQEKMKKADQEFTESENEKNRQNTLDVARMNKEEQKAAQDKEYKDAAERAKDVYMAYRRRLSIIPEEDPRRAELEDQLRTAEILMKQAYRKAKMLDEYDEIIKDNASEEDQTLGDRKTIMFKALGVADDNEFKSLYESGDTAQKAEYGKMAKSLGIPLTKLGVSGTKAKDDQTKEQKEKAAKTKKDFKNKNAKKTFEINILDGKAVDPQAWSDFSKSAANAGWTVELQSDGTILWK